MACKPWSDIVRQHSTGSDCGMEWSNALFKGPPPDGALCEDEFVRELLSQSRYLDKSARPDLVIVTATPSWEPRLQAIADAIIASLPNRKSVHLVCCVAVGIIGTDSEGRVHEIEDGSSTSEAIAMALLHLGFIQRVFSLAERNNSARERKKQFISSAATGADAVLDEITAFAAEDEAGACTPREQRSVLGFLVGDNVYDVSDLKTKIEARIENIHLMGGLCGYDTRKQAVYYSSPAFRKFEEEESTGPRWKRPRISAAALFVCNLRTTRASYRGIKQLMQDYMVDRVEMDEDGSKVFSLRKCLPGGWDSNCRARSMPMYQVLKDLEEVHGSLHGVTFGVKRRAAIAIDSNDDVVSVNSSLNNSGVEQMSLDSSGEDEDHKKRIRSRQPQPELRTQVESVDIVRGVWDTSSPGNQGRLDAIVVPLDLKPNDVCSFYTYGADESLRELEEILETVRVEDDRQSPAMGAMDYLLTPPPHRLRPADPAPASAVARRNKKKGACFGGLLVICNARGTYLHSGRPNVESDVIARHLPDTPVIGFFANGEVGPMPFREYNPQTDSARPKANTVLQGNTSVLTLLRK